MQRAEGAPGNHRVHFSCSPGVAASFCAAALPGERARSQKVAALSEAEMEKTERNRIQACL